MTAEPPAPPSPFEMIVEETPANAGGMSGSPRREHRTVAELPAAIPPPVRATRHLEDLGPLVRPPVRSCRASPAAALAAARHSPRPALTASHAFMARTACPAVSAKRAGFFFRHHFKNRFRQTVTGSCHRPAGFRDSSSGTDGAVVQRQASSPLLVETETFALRPPRLAGARSPPGSDPALLPRSSWNETSDIRSSAQRRAFNTT